MQWQFPYNSSSLYSDSYTKPCSLFWTKAAAQSISLLFWTGCPSRSMNSVIIIWQLQHASCSALIFFQTPESLKKVVHVFEFYVVLVSDLSLFPPQTVTLKATSPWPRTPSSLSLHSSLTLSSIACVLGHFPRIPNRCAPDSTALRLAPHVVHQ